jgi:hypothetical protein
LRDTGCICRYAFSIFQPGDLLCCDVVICNQTGWNLNDAVLFLVLEYNGEFFFGPSFGKSLDSFYEEHPTFGQGKTTIPVIPAFAWPAGLGSASGVRFYAALTGIPVTTLYGNYGMAEFGWGD